MLLLCLLRMADLLKSNFYQLACTVCSVLLFYSQIPLISAGSPSTSIGIGDWGFCSCGGEIEHELLVKLRILRGIKSISCCEQKEDNFSRTVNQN